MNGASDRDTLMEARRLAHWGALERMRQSEREHQKLELAMCRPAPLREWPRSEGWRPASRGKRADQLEFSLLVLGLVCWVGVAIVVAMLLIEARKGLL